MAKKFTELTTASQINETDITAISQETNGAWGSFKATISAIAQKIITGINFANAFNTNAKTVAGAVNEKLTSNAVADIEVSPAESAHSEGDYLIYNGLLYLVIDDIAIGDALTTGTGGNIEAAQIADGIGGGGGHEILNDAGSALPQENKLQFKGVYSHDDSTNGKTVVDVTREMTEAEFEQLPAAEKVGVIRITDDNFVCDSTEVKHSTGVSIKNVLDVQEITTADLSAFADSTKVKIFQMDKFVQISFNGAKVASNVGRYGELIKSLPTNIQNFYASNYVAKLASGTTAPILFYLNPNSNKMQTDVAISTTDEIWGSMSYLCQ